jgi:aryl-alcohol dehydrogenase-like predicted oxidoreductase
MEYIQIEGLPRQASRIGLGTWAIGGWMWGGTEESEAIGTIHAALEDGINLIDTAPVYGFGRSEELVGKALGGGRRERAIIATKVGLNWESGKILRNSSPVRLRQELEDSLCRLNTDVIDIYQVHWPDESVPFEETAKTLDTFKCEGKIRAIGVSNFSPIQMDRFRKGGLFAAIQPPYNLFEREIEKDVLPYAKRNSLAVLAYGALCRGLLSGKITAKTHFEGDDLRKVDPKFRQPRLGHYLEAVAHLEQFARDCYGKSVLALAIRWLLDQGEIIALWGRAPPRPACWGQGRDGLATRRLSHAEIDRILAETIKDRVGPEFMAPPPSHAAPAATARAAARR